MSAADLARAYYAGIDDPDYERLRAALAPSFVHRRPDRTLDGADRFVSFMREERPTTDVTHELDRVYAGPDGVAVCGRLVGDDGDGRFAFVDVFRVDPDAHALREVRTYADRG